MESGISIQQPPATFATKDIPTLYCNQATMAMSFNDVRVYLSEVSPAEVSANPTGGELQQKTALIQPRLCLVMTPEMARSLIKIMTTALEKYEGSFGPLRPEPTPESIKALFKK